MGYKESILNYTKLRYPSRCTQIKMGYGNEVGRYDIAAAMRTYVKNIKKIELPNTVR